MVKATRPILNNAIQAIRCGIEDYSTGGDARLKSSIRNVHAGMLLTCPPEVDPGPIGLSPLRRYGQESLFQTST